MRRMWRPPCRGALWRGCADTASKPSANHAGAETAAPSFARRVLSSQWLHTALAFGVGWGAWIAAERFEVIPAERIAGGRLAVWQGLHALRHSDDSQLPASLRAALDERELLQVPPPPQRQDSEKRQSFCDVLSQCPMDEQLDWLGEQVSEEIPYFFIEELVHTFACLQCNALYYTAPSDEAVASRAAMAARAKLPSRTPDGVDELVAGIWRLTRQGSITPAAGWGALAALTTTEDYAAAVALHAAHEAGITDRKSLDERTAVLAFTAVVDAAMVAVAPEGAAATETLTPVGPPTDVRTGADVVLAVPRMAKERDYAACDPVVAVLANVDRAVTRRVLDRQSRRFDFRWASPATWLNPVLRPADSADMLSAAKKGVLSRRLPASAATVLEVAEVPPREREWLRRYVAAAGSVVAKHAADGSGEGAALRAVQHSVAAWVQE